jgi:phosphopantothenoylcysteine decarboxylase/phosphopantothenate--cysteine ligase
VDLVAANRVGVPGSGFESETNALTVIDADGERELGPATKAALAATLVELIAGRL